VTIKATPYDELMAQRLQDKALAIAYLNESLQDEDDLTMFLVALRRVVDAQGVRMTELSKRSGLTRESLYKMLSDKGNPELASIKSVLDALGYRLSISSDEFV
jgi:probable addiction module antidote protein